MNEEGLSIKVWTQKKLEGAIEQAAEALRYEVSEYEHGKLTGAIEGYHNVLIELGPANAWKREYNTFSAWINEVCDHSPLTVGDAIAIYDFCDRNDLLKQQDIVENVIALGLRRYCRYDITNLLKLEALKGGKWIHKGLWRRKK